MMIRNKYLSIAILIFCLCACDNNPFNVNDLDLAKDAYAERNMPLAERVLERYLRQEQDPEQRWLAWNLLLQAINADRQHARASLECLDSMVIEYEEDPAKMAEILPQIGSYSKMQRNFEKAVEAWNAYLDLAEINSIQRVNGLRQLASMQFAQKHYEAAEDSLQQCLGLPLSDHDKIACMLDLAEENMMRENWQEVADLCQQILDSDPDREIYGKANYLRGDALEQMGKIEEALAVFELARESYPNPLVIENRISYLKKKNK